VSTVMAIQKALTKARIGLWLPNKKAKANPQD
jgi:hypothetical protein